jgi:hypothetical protein
MTRCSASLSFAPDYLELPKRHHEHLLLRLFVSVGSEQQPHRFSASSLTACMLPVFRVCLLPLPLQQA